MVASGRLLPQVDYAALRKVGTYTNVRIKKYVRFSSGEQFLVRSWSEPIELSQAVAIHILHLHDGRIEDAIRSVGHILKELRKRALLSCPHEKYGLLKGAFNILKSVRDSR